MRFNFTDFSKKNQPTLKNPTLFWFWFKSHLHMKIEFIIHFLTAMEQAQKWNELWPNLVSDLLDDPKRIDGFLRTLVLEATEVLPSANMISQNTRKTAKNDRSKQTLVKASGMTHKTLLTLLTLSSNVLDSFRLPDGAFGTWKVCRRAPAGTLDDRDLDLAWKEGTKNVEKSLITQFLLFSFLRLLKSSFNLFS